MTHLNQDQEDISYIPVLCVNYKCHSEVLVKDALTGFDAGEFFCSFRCKQEYLTVNKVS
jgi:hypothetical protein